MRPRSYTMEEYAKATSPETRSKIILSEIDKQGWGMTPFVNIADDFKSKGFNVSNKGGVFVIEKPKESKEMEEPKSEEPKSPGAKEEDYPFSDEENEDIYTAMYESGDPDYTDFYLKKYPEMRNKNGDIDYKYSTPELGKEYMKQHPELWKQTREWLDVNKEVDEGEEKKYQEELSKLDTNDNGKIEVDEMADFQKSLDDYASKNKKGRDDIPVTTRR